jgi:hypothetical protein
MQADSDRLLAEAHRRIAAAKRRAGRPTEDIQAFGSIEMHIAIDDWPHIWELVWKLREVDPETFNRSTENAAAAACVRVLASLDSAPTLDRLVNLLAGEGGEDTRHLVLTPLANLAPPADYTELSKDAALIRAPLLDSREADLVGPAREQFGDWIRPSFRLHELRDGGEFDTRNGAALLSEEIGGAPVATDRARMKARYAIAVWSVLRPPSEEEIMADTGTWLPQPWIHQPQACTLMQTEPWMRRPAQREWVAHKEYEPPAGEAELQLPFQAFGRVESSRSAQALLSASWSLAQAGRASRLTLSDRLIKLYAAVAALCDPGIRQVSGSEVLTRWNRLAVRVGTWEAIAQTRYRGLDPQLANERLKDARDIATHGADAVLLDLGYPIGRERKIAGRRVAEPSSLAVASLSSDLSALLHAARHATRTLWLETAAADWSDSKFFAYFE